MSLWGVNCTVQATACNEYDVPMCANCLSIHNRIRRGSSVSYNGRRIRDDELLEAMNRDMMNRMNRLREAATSRLSELREQQPQSFLGDVAARGQYFGDGPSPFTPPQEEELGEEDCTCNNLDHSQFNEECPLNEERTPVFDANGRITGYAYGAPWLQGVMPLIEREEGDERE